QPGAGSAAEAIPASRDAGSAQAGQNKWVSLAAASVARAGRPARLPEPRPAEAVPPAGRRLPVAGLRPPAVAGLRPPAVAGLRPPAVAGLRVRPQAGRAGEA